MKIVKLDLAGNKGIASVIHNNFYDTLEVKSLKKELLQKEFLIADLTETIKKKGKLTDMIEDIHTAIMECGVILERENSKDQLNLFRNFECYDG